VRLGGYAILARTLDKGRAVLAGRAGEYKFDCPLDQHVLAFAGIKAAGLKAQLAKGKSDSDILAWIEQSSTTKPTPWAIAQWSAYQDQRSPGDAEYQEFFTGVLKQLAPQRSDVATWFDLLDLDDYVSFGGQA
jgi:hypothetical protein